MAADNAKPPSDARIGVPRAFDQHDHVHCVDSALAEAERVCAERGAQFTPIRRRVFELLLESHRPVGAYALLDRLRQEKRGSQPPTVYRALDFLMEQGLVHKIMKINAFTACCRPGERHAPQFLICTGCDRISEMSDPKVAEALERAAAEAGFAARHAALELSGLCPGCAKDGAPETEAKA